MLLAAHALPPARLQAFAGPALAEMDNPQRSSYSHRINSIGVQQQLSARFERQLVDRLAKKRASV